MKVFPGKKSGPIALFEKKLAIHYGIWGPLASYLRKCYKPNPEYMQKLLKTRQQIAAEYGVDRKTLYRWLKAHDIQHCWTIYTGTLENPYAHSYEDCVDVYNYMFICNTDSADDEGAGGGGGGGGNGSTSDSGMQENEGTGGAICNTIATVLELSGIYSESRPCYIQVSVSGCDFSNCNLFFEGGDLACGATLNSEFLGISFPVGVAYQIGNPICIASRTSSTYDSQARNYIICGNLYVRFELLFSVFGISDSFGIITRNISSCYRCHNC